MSAGMLFVLWKGFLGFVLPIGVGFWELHQLRKYRLADEAKAPQGVAPALLEHHQPATAAERPARSPATVLEPA